MCATDWITSRKKHYYCYYGLIVYTGIIAEVSTFWHHLLKSLNKEYNFKPHCQLMTGYEARKSQDRD